MVDHQYRSLQHSTNLLHLPLELLLRISEYLSFADVWYLATCSRYCRAIAHQIIWYRYHIDLSKPQLNAFNHMVHAALAYVSRHGYKLDTDTIDYTILQSVSNRLAVEIYDKSPLKNWEPCLDFFLDKSLGIIVDHMLLDPLLDVVPKHIDTTTHNKATSSILEQDTSNIKHYYRPLLMTDFYPTRMGRLITSFLTTFYPTLTALFEIEPITEIHHRLLLNHIHRHLDSLATRYHSHYNRRLLLVTSSTTSPRASTIMTLQQHSRFLRLNFCILIRFIGTLVKNDLLSANDLNTITRQRIQFFFLNDNQRKEEEKERQHERKRVKLNQLQKRNHSLTLYESLKKNATHYCWQMWFEEIEFQIEIFLDLTKVVILLERSSRSRTDLSVVSSMLDNTISALISTKRSNGNSVLLPPSSSNTSTTTTTAAAAV
ncbi:uncharacterized protein BX663DRAFT_512753 [Cokeromyces recurvatus]|uniref:uncharacterized protein n=1 Tax=Cokeromyces recurvatus TaxID=90255 RepID=UPI00221F163B|nr:uncharacterized protein BX663DRAFT_512753 [Cokeromyces recurvatus]KAI7901890.1 hypothetical protein BX663DRAFT_512753 [Cokeromyces recurvatus]